MKPVITKRALLTWLAPYTDNAVIGQRRSHDSCPIAELLRHQGFLDVEVTTPRPRHYGIRYATSLYGFFSWRDHNTFTRKLIKAVDYERYNTHITAGELRQILATL